MAIGVAAKGKLLVSAARLVTDDRVTTVINRARWDDGKILYDKVA